AHTATASSPKSPRHAIRRRVTRQAGRRTGSPCVADRSAAEGSYEEGIAMDWKGFVKRLDLPDGFPAPTELAFGDVRARAISRADLDEDVRGINASIDLIRRTRGGKWPTGPVTADYNYVDLVWHECEFRD